MATSCRVDYDGGGAADGYYDSIDQQRVEEAISSHDPGDVYSDQAPIGMYNFSPTLCTNCFQSKSLDG